jgi:hypothetical protein
MRIKVKRSICIRIVKRRELKKSYVEAHECSKGAEEAHSGGLDKHSSAVVGLQASVADSLNIDQDQDSHKKSRIRIRIKVKRRIKIRNKVKSRIRISARNYQTQS